MEYSIDQYPLLYQLFLKIQKYDRHLGHQALGVKEYFILMEAFNNGIDLRDEEQFKKVLTLLWRKPHHNKEIFDNLLEEGLQYIYQKNSSPEAQAEGPSKSATPKTSRDTQSSIETRDNRTERPSSVDDVKTSVSDLGQIEEDSLIISFERADPDKEGANLKIDIDQISREINKHHFLLQGNYFELGSRQLQQGVRTMRQRVADKTKKEIDLEATILKVSRQGFLEGLEYRYGQKWTTNLLIIIDHGDSMIAFEPFADELITVIDEDYDIKRSVYFYTGIPYEHLFADRTHRQEVLVDKLAEMAAQSILIVSDGGAATGKIDETKVEDTVDFLAKIRKHRVAWLNPMPRDRWKGTSAEYIALYTSMFFLDATELVNVVKLFKSKMKPNTLLDQYVEANYW